MLISVEFEVFGRVQGVFFRKYTYRKAKELGLNGFVQNTGGGTVIGVLEGESNEVEQMKNWLSKIGSPSSQIDKCVFSNEKKIDGFTYQNFKIAE